VTRAALECELVLLACDTPGLAPALQALLPRFAAAYLSRFGHEREHLEFRAWFSGKVDADSIGMLGRAAGSGDGESVEYEDERRGVSKRLVFRGGELAAACLCGETAAAGWLREAMARGGDAEFLRRYALAPIARLPSARPARGRVVCSCLDVAEAEIAEAMARGADFERLRATLKCGTSCGSCVPELRRLAAAQAVTTSGAPA